MSITAIVMIGEKGGNQDPVEWVLGARMAATYDLIEQLLQMPQIKQIVIVSPSLDWDTGGSSVYHVQSTRGSIHVGQYLTQVVKQYHVEKLLYFGGSSAPLLDDASLNDILNRLENAKEIVLTNNQFASDWAGIAPATIVCDWEERLPKDNMLGWVLSSEASLPVYALRPSAASRLDIDTPTDLLALKLHPGTKYHLSYFLKSLPLNSNHLEEALKILSTDASQVFISGRIGPDAWIKLNQATRAWIRVVSEERGMISSGRQKRGEVYSILADHITNVGVSSFFQNLSQNSQAAFIDSRVLMAHHRIWPSESDRFSSDLGMVGQIKNDWLREFTEAALGSPIPVILGGHGLMAGNLFAFCDLL